MLDSLLKIALHGSIEGRFIKYPIFDQLSPDTAIEVYPNKIVLQMDQYSNYDPCIKSCTFQSWPRTILTISKSCGCADSIDYGGPVDTLDFNLVMIIKNKLKVFQSTYILRYFDIPVRIDGADTDFCCEENSEIIFNEEYYTTRFCLADKVSYSGITMQNLYNSLVSYTVNNDTVFLNADLDNFEWNFSDNGACEPEPECEEYTGLKSELYIDNKLIKSIELTGLSPTEFSDYKTSETKYVDLGLDPQDIFLENILYDSNITAYIDFRSNALTTSINCGYSANIKLYNCFDDFCSQRSPGYYVVGEIFGIELTVRLLPPVIADAFQLLAAIITYASPLLPGINGYVDPSTLEIKLIYNGVEIVVQVRLCDCPPGTSWSLRYKTCC